MGAKGLLMKQTREAFAGHTQGSAGPPLQTHLPASVRRGVSSFPTWSLSQAGPGL